MTTLARILIDVTGHRMTEFEADLARLAQKYGTNLERSADPRMPLHYSMPKRYVATNPTPHNGPHRAA
jgi:hypothetical protein